MSKKWTIVSVNYKTESYFPWKLKSFYEFENKDNFEYIVVDNSQIHDKPFWDDLKNKYSGLRVIPFIPIDVGRTSGEHAEGLNVGLNEAKKNNSDYLLVYDPDFFWVQKNLLDYFEREFKNENYVAIGSPYTIALQHSNSQIPCAFGAAYSMKFLEGIDFSTSKDPHELLIVGRDVGWKIREKVVNTNSKFLTFSQSDVPMNERFPGQYSFEAILRQYFLNGKIISFHLHRGSFDDGLTKFQAENWRSDRSKDLHQPCDEWLFVREWYCQRYYDELKKSTGYL